MTRLLALSLAASFVGSVSTARADVPPSTPETCVLEKAQRAGETCEACSTYYAEANKCGKQYEGTAFKQHCRTSGASTWTEIWCRPETAAAEKAEPAPTTPAAAEAPAPVAAKSSCASTSLGLVGVAGLAALLRRRRR